MTSIYLVLQISSNTTVLGLEVLTQIILSLAFPFLWVGHYILNCPHPPHYPTRWALQSSEVCPSPALSTVHSPRAFLPVGLSSSLYIWIFQDSVQSLQPVWSLFCFIFIVFNGGSWSITTCNSLWHLAYHYFVLCIDMSWSPSKLNGNTLQLAPHPILTWNLHSS